MLVQGGMWIIGGLLIFSVFFLLGRGFLALFCKETNREKAERKLKDKIEKLECIKLSLETKKLEASIGGEMLKLETEIAKTNKGLGKLKTQLDSIQGGSNGYQE